MTAPIKFSFFSISFDLITLDRPLTFDIYLNASGKREKEHFVCIIKKGSIVDATDIKNYRKKYPQFYVREDDRNAYLKSLMNHPQGEEINKATVLKDAAIKHLEKLFSPGTELSTEVLQETIVACKDQVESMVSLIRGKDIEELRDLIGKLSFHDFYTYDHSINVSMYCITILQTLKPNASDQELMQAGLGGFLHDLGKIKIPTTIINNPGKLSDEDFEQIRKHPSYGLELLDEHPCQCEGVNFEVIQRVIFEHHENFNGTGYPRGLDGENIHLLARITAIADFFDAITTKRSYHEVLSTEEALNVMSKTVGKKLDPKLFQLFAQAIQTKEEKNPNKAVERGILPDDFDPCQPHASLLLNVPPERLLQQAGTNTLLGKKKLELEQDKTFGKVKLAENLFGKEKVEKKKAS